MKKMLKLFCDPCGSEIRDGEARGELAAVEVKILQDQPSGVKTTTHLCRHCLRKLQELLGKLKDEKK